MRVELVELRAPRSTWCCGCCAVRSDFKSAPSTPLRDFEDAGSAYPPVSKTKSQPNAKSHTPLCFHKLFALVCFSPALSLRSSVSSENWRFYDLTVKLTLDIGAKVHTRSRVHPETKPKNPEFCIRSTLNSYDTSPI